MGISPVARGETTEEGSLLSFGNACVVFGGDGVAHLAGGWNEESCQQRELKDGKKTLTNHAFATNARDRGSVNVR